MLNSFKIRLFRAFRELKVDRLAQVNLLVGQNNSGKTTFLEALSLFAHDARPDAIYKLLAGREELVGGENGDSRDVEVDIASLFHGRVYAPEQDVAISLGEAHAPRHKVTIKASIVQRILSSGPAPAMFQEITPDDARAADVEVYPAIAVEAGSQRSLVVRDRGTWSRALRRPRGIVSDLDAPLIHAVASDEEAVLRWWDSVALQAAEERVLACLNLVCPVERITTVGSPRRSGRLFKVKLKGETQPQPLKSLGNGVARIFQTALALEYSRRPTPEPQRALFDEQPLDGNATSGLLLIDEVETGIHYSALADYWSILFRMSRDLGVQIVATTHSWDCIEGMQAAARNDPHADVQLIRLEASRDAHKAVLFDKKELAIVTRDQIEVR